MLDIESLLKDGPPEKGSYLSRVFGIFSEEIIRIWARDNNSPYQLHDKRPTLYYQNHHSTLDFLLIRDDKSYVAEMKCEIQYQGYRYWRLNHPDQLNHHKTKKAFELFIISARKPEKVVVKAGYEIKISGAILVWGAATSEGIKTVKDRYSFENILTVEACITDLIAWKNEEYLSLIEDRQSWVGDFFTLLKGNEIPSP